MSRKNIYLVLAIIGAVVPYYFFIQQFITVGFGIGSFLSALFANPPASGFTSDLLITSLVFWIAMFHRHSLGKGPGPLLFIILTVTIGLSCALPAYLYASEGNEEQLAAAS